VTVRKINPLHLGAVTVLSLILGLFLKWRFNQDLSDWWEFAGFVTGVVAVYLAAIEHIVNWPISIVNVVIYAWVFYQTRLFADMTLQFLFLALSIHGWWEWAHGGNARSKRLISRIKPQTWILLGALWIAGTLVYMPIVSHFKDSAPFLDSTLTVGSMIAQVMLNLKKIENWMLWIVIDSAYIPLYVSKHLQATAVLYGLFLILAVVGLVSWMRTVKGTLLTEPFA
jgi:nicotinamide mononucleotide transporter